MAGGALLACSLLDPEWPVKLPCERFGNRLLFDGNNQVFSSLDLSRLFATASPVECSPTTTFSAMTGDLEHRLITQALAHSLCTGGSRAVPVGQTPRGNQRIQINHNAQ
jgi:hypothetical protein